MTTPAGGVSVIVPAWNAAARLPACLDALAAQTNLADEVIVVDNGSTDGTATLVRARFGWARLVANPVNFGFARAVNQGILAASGATIVLLNDDTMADPGCLAALVAPLAADARLGVSAATLVYADRPEQINAAGLTIGHDLVAMDAGLSQPVAALPDAPWPVFGASGGAAAYRRAALDDVGLFDERFFAYLEDVDLAWRLRLRRWGAVSVPAARVRHAYSASAGADSPFKRYHLARNRVWWLVKCVPGALAWRCAAALLWYDAAALLAALAGRDTAWLQGRLDGLRGIPALRADRGIIQQRRTASIDELAALLGPRVGPWRVWQARRTARQVTRRP
ncbi:MAG: glycosyltransferase family 2 protein [Chloroflexi bacterium]|nr:glycosyltransferase family 2 protein [Chloroflexota bacterium]